MRVTWKLTAKRSTGRCKGANKKDIYRSSSHLFFFPGSFSLFRLWGLCIDLVVQHGDADWLTITPCIKLQLCPRIYSLSSPSSAIPRMCFTVRAPLVTNSSSALTCSLDLIRRLCVSVRVYDRRANPLPRGSFNRGCFSISLVDCISNKSRTPGSIRESDSKLLGCEKLALRTLRCRIRHPDGAFEWCRCIARGADAAWMPRASWRGQWGRKAREVHRLINSFLIISDN